MRGIVNLPSAIVVTASVLIAGGWLASELSPAPRERSIPAAAVFEYDGHDGLRIEVEAVRNARGNIIVTVYDAADALAAYDERYAAYRVSRADEGTMTFDFPSLTGGPYAVTVHHDENADWDYDGGGSGWLEGWGVSGATEAYDEPGFARASVPPGGVRVRVFYYD